MGAVGSGGVGAGAAGRLGLDQTGGALLDVDAAPRMRDLAGRGQPRVPDDVVGRQRFLEPSDAQRRIQRCTAQRFR